MKLSRRRHHWAYDQIASLFSATPIRRNRTMSKVQPRRRDWYHSYAILPWLTLARLFYMLIYHSYEISVRHTRTASVNFAIEEVWGHPVRWVHTSRTRRFIGVDRRQTKMTTKKKTDGQVLSVDWDHLIKKRKINIEKSTSVFEKHGRHTENV